VKSREYEEKEKIGNSTSRLLENDVMRHLSAKFLNKVEVTADGQSTYFRLSSVPVFAHALISTNLFLKLRKR
jgi:hypothetical protein